MTADINQARDRITIAIVDDDESVGVSLRRLCRVLGFDATAFSSARAFLETLGNGAARPDCLLIDLAMPEITGLELHRILIDRGESFPTIVITGDDDSEVVARCAALGLPTVLHKPIGASELLAVIQQATRSAPAAAERPLDA